MKKHLYVVNGAFTMNKFKTALKNTKYGKACGLANIPGEVWKIDDFNDILLQLCNALYFGSQIDK